MSEPLDPPQDAVERVGVSVEEVEQRALSPAHQSVHRLLIRDHVGWRRALTARGLSARLEGSADRDWPYRAAKLSEGSSGYETPPESLHHLNPVVVDRLARLNEFTRRQPRGDDVLVDLKEGLMKNLSRNEEYKIKPFPEFARNIIGSGGLMNYVKRKMEVTK